MRRSLFDDDFFNGFGFDPFGMGGMRPQQRPQRPQRAEQRHPLFYDPYAALQQQREEEELEMRRRQEAKRLQEERRRRLIEERRLQQQKLRQQQEQREQEELMDADEEDDDGAAYRQPQQQFFNPFFGASQRQQQPARMPFKSQPQPRSPATTRQRSRTMERQPDIPVPPVLASHPVFARLTPSQQQQFLRQQLQQQHHNEQREREAQEQAKQQAQFSQPQRMVCDETQTSDSEAEPDRKRSQGSRMVTEGTETAEQTITAKDFVPQTQSVDEGDDKIEFKDCDDVAAPASNKNDFEDCVETEKEAELLAHRIEHASTISEQDSNNTADNIDEEPAPTGENSSADPEAEAEPEEEVAAGPLRSLEEINKIKKDGEQIQERWVPEAFVPRTPENKESVIKARRFYSEGLLQCVIKLDSIDSFGDSKVRQARKQAIIALESKVDELKDFAEQNDAC